MSKKGFFYCKTDQAYIFKLLIDLIQSNIKDAPITIDKDGIRLAKSDTDNTTCITFDLKADNFTIYNYDSDTPKHFGVNVIHLFKMLKSIKKKDMLELLLDDESSDVLTIIHSVQGKVEKSTINIQEYQIEDIELPTKYTDHVSFQAQEYQKTCKMLESISKIAGIKMTPDGISFASKMPHMFNKHIHLGKYNENEVIYDQTFDTQQLNNLKRISGLGISSGSITFSIYRDNELIPLMIKTSVGTLGKICIYTKSKEKLENEKLNPN